MKYIGCIACILFIVTCSNKKIDPPESREGNFRMTVEGADRFENYIHDLSVYAFRKTAAGKYVYDKTIAELNETEIRNLQDASAKGNAKYYPFTIGVGTYDFYFIGNAAGRMNTEWEEGVTSPEDICIAGNTAGTDNVYFLGHTIETVVTEYRPAVAVTLNRLMSKLVFVLYGVPVQIDSVVVSLGNLASAVCWDGKLKGPGREITQGYTMARNNGQQKDTLVGEFLTLPSLEGGASFRILFRTVNGQEKQKEMPAQVLLPDRYARVTGIIENSPEGLLNFEVKFRFILFDYWLDYPLPDFILKPQKE